MHVALVSVALLLALALSWGISTALGSSSPSASPGTLVARFGTTDVVDNLNPFLGFTTPAYEIYHLNYNFLVGYDPSTPDLAPRPELATSWTMSPDGKVWTFHLRHGVKWQDGQPFTSKDVAFTFNYIIKNNLTAYTAFTRNITSVVALDPYTVQIHCSQPKANMLRLWIPIVPEHIWDKVSGKSAGTDYISKPPLVGTGPFQVVQYVPGSYVKLVRNPYYWDKGKPTIDQVILVLYTDTDAMVTDLKDGNIDYATGMSPEELKTLATDPSLTVDHPNERAFNAFVFNCYNSPNSLGNPVLRDPKFRQAVRWAIDKRKIVSIAYGGYASVAQGLFSPAVPAYGAWQPTPADAATFNLQKAGQLLTAAGYPLKNGVRLNKQGKPIVLRLWAVNSDVQAQSACKLLAGSLQAIGLKVVYTVLDEGALEARAYNYKGTTFAPDFDMYATTWTYWIDPDYLLNAYTTSQIQGWNDCGWSDAAYDKLYAQQAQTTDPTQRKALVDQAQEIFYSQAPYVVTSYPQQCEAYNTAKWDGWTRVPKASGPVAFLMDNVDTYLNLKPKVGAPKSGGANTLILTVVIVVVVLAVVAVLIVRRRRRPVTEEG